MKKLKAIWNPDDDQNVDVFDSLDKPNTLEKEMTKHRVGYWRGIPRKSWRGDFLVCDYLDCPDVKGFIDPTWDKDERKMVMDYLKEGMEQHRWCGYSTCRICGKHDNGDACLTDGTWVWPNGLVHYLEKHDVRLPNEFVEWVKKNNDNLDRENRERRLTKLAILDAKAAFRTKLA